MEHGQVKSWRHQEGTELLRRLLQGHLDLRAAEDGQLNLSVDQYSDGVRRRVAIEASKVSFAETSATLGETTGAQVGKRQCEEITVKVAQDFEAFYAQRSQEGTESTQDLLVLTTDGHHWRTEGSA